MSTEQLIALLISTFKFSYKTILFRRNYELHYCMLEELHRFLGKHLIGHLTQFKFATVTYKMSLCLYTLLSGDFTRNHCLHLRIDNNLLFLSTIFWKV